MAARKTKAAVKSTETPVTAAGNDSKRFTLSSLEKHCQKLYGVPTSTFAGATTGLDSVKEYSIDEIKEYIDKWKGKEAK